MMFFCFVFFINKDPFVDKTLLGVIIMSAELRDYCNMYINTPNYRSWLFNLPSLDED